MFLKSFVAVSTKISIFHKIYPQQSKMRSKVFVKMSEDQIYQEMREAFSKSPITTRNAIKALNNLLFVLSTNKVSEKTLEKIYVTLLKGFQSKDKYLKACIYSAITEMSKYTDEGFIGVNILINDLNSNISEEMKALALRALFSIVPDAMTYDFEKYIGQAAMSKCLDRKDAAVYISYKLLYNNHPKVKQWLEGLGPINVPIVDYHIAGFLAQANNLQSYNFESFKGPAGIIGVKSSLETIKNSGDSFNLLKRLLNSKNCDDIVFIEAAKAVTKMSEEIAIQFLPQTIQSLRIFLKSSNFALRFSSMRILSQLAQKYPQKVAVVNKEIEDLISSDNKTISMFAITTLLKTGTEETVDRLINLIPGSIHEMSDEFKKMAIDTLETLSVSFESKKNIFVDFLGSALIEKGGIEFKKYILTIIARIINDADTRERLLGILCFYLEDSQSIYISLDILGILGREIPKSLQPNKYVVHVLNRLVLENNHIRAAALQCLHNISSVMEPSTAENVIRGCLEDNDELVREISQFLLKNGEQTKDPLFFDLNELGDLKENVMVYLDENIQEHEESVDVNPLIKECRELIVTENTADVIVKVTKKIYEDRVITAFNLENKLEGVQVIDGVFSLVATGENGEKIETSLNMPTLNPDEAITIEKEWLQSLENYTLNGRLDYTICLEGDISDAETDHTIVEPFRISILDYVRPVEVPLPSENVKQISFALQGDVFGASKKILDLVNMKISAQDASSNSMSMTLTGTYNSTPVGMEVKILMANNGCKCDVEVFCKDSKVCDKIISLFD